MSRRSVFATPVFAQHRDARGMDDVGFVAARSQPARQPEAIASGLISEHDALDLVPGLAGFVCASDVKASTAASSASSLLRGWRATAVPTASTRHFDWLISMTGTIVLSCSRVVSRVVMARAARVIAPSTLFNSVLREQVPACATEQTYSSTRNHQSVQATMRISDSSDSRIWCPLESRFYESGY